MSRMSDLDLLLKESDDYYDQMIDLATSGKKKNQEIRELYTSTSSEANTEKHKREPKADKEMIRAKLAELASQGHTQEIKALLQKFGAEKLSDVDPKDYQDLYYSAEAMAQ